MISQWPLTPALAPSDVSRKKAQEAQKRPLTPSLSPSEAERVTEGESEGSRSSERRAETARPTPLPSLDS